MTSYSWPSSRCLAARGQGSRMSAVAVIWLAVACSGQASWAQEQPATAVAAAPMSPSVPIRQQVVHPVTLPAVSLGAQGAAPAHQVGVSTRRLLALQASGQHASPLQYSMPIDVASKVYARYLESFSHPIPEHLNSALDDVRTR